MFPYSLERVMELNADFDNDSGRLSFPVHNIRQNQLLWEVHVKQQQETNYSCPILRMPVASPEEQREIDKLLARMSPSYEAFMTRFALPVWSIKS